MQFTNTENKAPIPEVQYSADQREAIDKAIDGDKYLFDRICRNRKVLYNKGDC